MKLPLKWLKDYIDPKLSTEALVERLTMAGMEIEAVSQVAGDTVLEIEITPNRPDCLNILGLAREIGAITSKTVKYPKIKKYAILKDTYVIPKDTYVIPAKAGILNKKSRSPIKTFGDDTVCVEDKKDCSRYIATLIQDVNIAEAPQAMKQRLASVGTSTINSAVDITNFVLMEIGQPLHAFDYDKLAGGKIVVRRAKQGEKITTLDGVERKLDPSILVIADAQKPVAIAGIMGGMGTEITASTKNILLESAHFEMGVVRSACRSLGLRSDSSYRFERNVNIDGVLTGTNRATDLLLQLTGGKLTGRAEIFAKTKLQATKIQVKITDIESLLGLKINAAKIKKWLDALGFSTSPRKGAILVTAPSFRSDIKAEVDVIEEIARMIGFDQLPSSMPLIKSQNITTDKRPCAIKDKIRRVLTAQGADEIITLSMISSKALAKTNMANISKIKIFNPLSQDQELMRPSMLPSMLQAALTNINRGNKDLRLFEIGKRYFVDAEKDSLAILLTGKRHEDWRLSKKDTVELFDLKGMVEQIFAAIGMEPTYEPNEFPVLESGCASSIKLDGKYLGSFGRVDHQILDNWDIKNQDIYFAGIHLDDIYPMPHKTIKYQPISEFPAITRDISLGLKKEIPYKRVEGICKAQGGEILKQVQFIEQYLGDKIQPGYKALVFSLQYQSNHRTLREDEVNSVHDRIVQALVHELTAVRR